MKAIPLDFDAAAETDEGSPGAVQLAVGVTQR